MVFSDVTQVYVYYLQWSSINVDFIVSILVYNIVYFMYFTYYVYIIIFPFQSGFYLIYQ